VVILGRSRLRARFVAPVRILGIRGMGGGTVGGWGDPRERRRGRDPAFAHGGRSGALGAPGVS